MTRRATRRQRALLALLALVLALGALLYRQAELIVLGAEAYVYGYPLVMMDLTRQAAALATGPENQLLRVRRFPDAQFKGVVRPNVDTLYTTAFIDMARGPWVFEMAANDQRYEVMPFMDAWTNVFAAPGSRSSGSVGGQFLLAGPGWQGRVPEGPSGGAGSQCPSLPVARKLHPAHGAVRCGRRRPGARCLSKPRGLLQFL